MQLDVNIKRKSFRQRDGSSRDIFRDFSFVLPAGQLGAILGASGSGKTTLLRMIAQLDRSFEGHITLPQRGGAPKIGMVFQEPRLLAWRTVEQNIRLVAPEISPQQLTNLLERLGLAQHSAHYPGELSLGLARRVAFARALAIQPELLILDEPFASLDDALRSSLRTQIADIVETFKVTTLLVTHDLDDAIHLADQIFMLGGTPASLEKTLNVPQPRAMNAAQIEKFRNLQELGSR